MPIWSSLSSALVIREPWIDLILSGRKTWEMRSKSTRLRGPIALVRQGSGTIVGVARIVDSLPELSRQDYARTIDHHAIPAAMHDRVIASGWVHPWVLADVRTLARPVPYRHKNGAVVTVSLEREVVAAVLAQLSDAPEEAPPLPDVERVPSRPVRIAPAVPRPAPSSDTGAAEGIPVVVRLSGGNIRNNHISLRTAIGVVPADGIGGGNRSNAARPFRVTFEPGRTIETDVAGDKAILRERAAVGDFFAHSGAQEGDRVELSRIGPRHLRVRLIPR